MAEPSPAWLERAQKFALEEVAPRAKETDAGVGVQPDLIRKMGELRYLGATFPEKYGGLGMDPIAYGQLTEIIGKACVNARALLTLQVSLVGESILKWGTPQQIDRWIPQMARGDIFTAFALSEPSIGTDAKNVETSYVKDGATYVINGRKKWITCGGIADMYLVLARDGEDATAFLVDRKTRGISTRPITGLLGTRGAHVAEIFFERVVVPEENVLGGIGNGFRFVANTALDHGRYSIAWAGVAIAQAALEAMVSYARQRVQFGNRLHEFQLIKGIIGDSTTRVHAARALCLRAAELRKADHVDAIIETAMAKYFASQVANQVATDAVQVHGGNGCQDNYPVERYFREAKVLEIIEGTSQIQQQIIAKHAIQNYFVKDYSVNRDRP